MNIHRSSSIVIKKSNPKSKAADTPGEMNFFDGHFDLSRGSEKVSDIEYLSLKNLTNAKAMGLSARGVILLKAPVYGILERFLRLNREVFFTRTEDSSFNVNKKTHVYGFTMWDRDGEGNRLEHYIQIRKDTGKTPSLELTVQTVGVGGVDLSIKLLERDHDNGTVEVNYTFLNEYGIVAFNHLMSYLRCYNGNVHVRKNVFGWIAEAGTG